MSFTLEPVLEKLPLGGLAGAVGTLKGDQQSALLFAGYDGVAEVPWPIGAALQLVIEWSFEKVDLSL